MYKLNFNTGQQVASQAFSAAGLTINQFALNLLETNKTQWFHGCKSQVALRHTAALRNGGARPTKALSSLISDGGEVVVTLRGGEGAPSAPLGPGRGRATR